MKVWKSLAGTALIAGVVAARVATPPTTVPAGATTAADRGKVVYEAHCISCHGASGQGDGPAASLLAPRPRNFTSGVYKLRSTESGSPPTDEDLLHTIAQGMPGTSMPAWKTLLSETDIRAVATYIKMFSPRFASAQPRPVTLPAETPASPASVSAGQEVFSTLQCSGCHGTDGRGTGALVWDLQDDWGQEIRPADLTEPWRFRGGATTRDVFLRVKTGMDGTPMPSNAAAATDQEIWTLAQYVVSLGRKPAWAMTAEELGKLHAANVQEAKNNPVDRGRYLANTLGCADCHSPLRPDSGLMEEFRLAGGQRWRINPYGEFITYNLTSDKATGLGNWTDDQIKASLTRGVRPDGSRLLPFPMPWPGYASMTPADLDALIAYLRTIPPISNRITPVVKPTLMSYFAGKFRMLILGHDQPGYVYPGNAGTPGK